MQSKITVRFHFTPIRMAIIKNAENNKRWWGCDEIGTLVYCCWEHKMLQPLWQFLKKSKIELPYDPEISLLGIYPKELQQGLEQIFVHPCSSSIHNSQKGGSNPSVH